MIYFVHDVIAPRSKSVREFAKYPTFIDVHLSDWYWKIVVKLVCAVFDTDTDQSNKLNEFILKACKPSINLYLTVSYVRSWWKQWFKILCVWWCS